MNRLGGLAMSVKRCTLGQVAGCTEDLQILGGMPAAHRERYKMVELQPRPAAAFDTATAITVEHRLLDALGNRWPTDARAAVALPSIA